MSVFHYPKRSAWSHFVHSWLCLRTGSFSCCHLRYLFETKAWPFVLCTDKVVSLCFLDRNCIRSVQYIKSCWPVPGLPGGSDGKGSTCNAETCIPISEEDPEAGMPSATRQQRCHLTVSWVLGCGLPGGYPIQGVRDLGCLCSTLSVVIENWSIDDLHARCPLQLGESLSKEMALAVAVPAHWLWTVWETLCSVIIIPFLTAYSRPWCLHSHPATFLCGPTTALTVHPPAQG